jgi:tetratricopeptide (TPR) repeat protein
MENRKYYSFFILCYAIAIIITPLNSDAQGKRTFSPEHYKELIKLRANVEADMSNLKKHELFINTWGPDSTLILQYKIWMKRYPKNAVAPFVIGRMLAGQEKPEAEEFLLKAVEINPKLAEAWDLLAGDAELRGDINSAGNYSEKAVKLDSLNADYAFRHTWTYHQTDTAFFHSLSNDLLKRFPKSELAAALIYWSAEEEKDANKKIAYFELLRDKFSALHSAWYRAGMNAYYKLVFIRDPQKGLEIARSQKIEGRIRLSEAVISVKELLEQQNPKEANEIA